LRGSSAGPSRGAPIRSACIRRRRARRFLNDAFYGDPEVKLLLSGLKRGYKGREDEKPLITLALHASALTVKHPTTKEPLTITAPLPHELEVGLKYPRKFAADGGRR